MHFKDLMNFFMAIYCYSEFVSILGLHRGLSRLQNGSFGISEEQLTSLTREHNFFALEGYGRASIL